MQAASCPSLLGMCREPVARQLLGLGDLLWCHELGDNVAGLCRFNVALGGSQVEQHVCLNVVLVHALAVAVPHPEVVLVIGEALISSFAIPLRRLNVVLRYALAQVVHVPEGGLGVGTALLGGLALPGDRLNIVLRYA